MWCLCYLDGGLSNLKLNDSNRELRKGLRTEEEIMSSWNKTLKNPFVSICCITYNHGEFIEDALNSFLMQETEFPFEIIIHDDASTDNTQSIIRQYEEKYPSIIKTIFQQENRYSKGISVANYYIPHLRGIYVAHCEGDDYWTDRFKLKKQIEFLEDNPDYIACYHNVRVVDEYKQKLHGKMDNYPYKSDHTITFKDIEQVVLPGQTASVLYRNHWLIESRENIDLFLNCKVNGDVKLAVMLGVKGKIFFMSDVMADHRRVIGEGDSWTAKNYGKNLSQYYYEAVLNINDFIYKAYGIKLKNDKKRRQVVVGAIYYSLKSRNRQDWRIARTLIGQEKGERTRLFFHFILHTLKWPYRKIQQRCKRVWQ